MGRGSSKGSKCHNIQVLVILLSIFISDIGLSRQLVDRLLAEVNGDVITYSEVKAKVDKGPLIVMSPYPLTAKDDQFKVALNDAINTKLVMMKAAELGLTINDTELNNEIEKFATRRKMTVDSLKEAIAGQGMTFEKYKQDFKMQIIMSRFQGREIMPQVKITEKDAKLYYLRTEGSEGQVFKLHLRQLFIAIKESDSDVIKDSKKELLSKVEDQLDSGVPFEEVVKLYSEAPNAKENGGKMPALSTTDLSGLFKENIEKLKVGESTKPIKAPNGYYIFKLESKEVGDSSKFNLVKNKIMQQLRQQEVQKKKLKDGLKSKEENLI